MQDETINSNAAAGSNPQRVTKVERQKGDQTRVSVFLDGAFAFGLDREVASKAGLHAGLEITSDEIEELLAQEQVSRATAAALHWLTVRARSGREVVRRLKQKGYDEATVDSVIEQLQVWRYLDDHAFARQWIENRDTHRPRGQRMLASELAAKGVSRPVITQALDDRSSDEVELACRAAETRLRSLQSLSPEVRRQRLQSFLARRGFDYGTIKKALAAIDVTADDAGDDSWDDPGE